MKVSAHIALCDGTGVRAGVPVRGVDGASRRSTASPPIRRRNPTRRGFAWFWLFLGGGRGGRRRGVVVDRPAPSRRIASAATGHASPMLVELLPPSQGAQAAGHHARVPDAARGAREARRLAVDRRLLHALARVPRQGRAALRPLRPRVRSVLQGRRTRSSTSARRFPRSGCEREFQRNLSDEDKKLVEALGGLGQADGDASSSGSRSSARATPGGTKWIGTGGTSPFGAYGYNPEGIRIGQDGGGNRSAVKVWDERSFRNLDGDVELNTRNIKVALRRLRRFAREGVPEELDLDGTIDGTARNAGWLDLKLQPERRNRVKVLLFLDVGGSMDPHVEVCEELFSAAKSGVPPPRALLLPQLRLRPRLARQRAPPQRARWARWS